MSRRPENILVVGVFDLFHEGHVRLLAVARELGDRLIVIVNGDRFTGNYKREPIIDEAGRLSVVQACRYVDVAEISNVHDVKPFVLKYGITQIVHGDDWNIESYKRQIGCDDAFLAAQQTRLVFVPYTKGISTSDIIRRCGAACQTSSRAL